jgi:hypothetical protein
MVVTNSCEISHAVRAIRLLAAEVLASKAHKQVLLLNTSNYGEVRTAQFANAIHSLKDKALPHPFLMSFRSTKF